MLVPVEAVTLDEAVPAEHHLAAGIRARLPAVESDRSRVRITVGVSAPAESVTACSARCGHDDQHRAELLPTLREFLACSGSWNACAAKMYVHVNTVRYRIRRIEELTGRNLSCLDDQVDFFLALRIR